MFNLIQHLQRRLDGGFRLVGIEAAGFEIYPGIIPADDRLHKGIGTTSGGNGYGLVRQHRERAAQVGIDLAKGTDERVVLAVAGCRLFVCLAVDLYFQRGYRPQSLRQR